MALKLIVPTLCIAGCTPNVLPVVIVSVEHAPIATRGLSQTLALAQEPPRARPAPRGSIPLHPTLPPAPIATQERTTI